MDRGHIGHDKIDSVYTDRIHAPHQDKNTPLLLGYRQRGIEVSGTYVGYEYS